MKVKVLQTQHSEETLHLAGSFRNVDDNYGRQLIEAGLAEDADAPKEKKEIKIGAKGVAPKTIITKKK